jgi:NIMA (never in mitosis gene a)-related kinase
MSVSKKNVPHNNNLINSPLLTTIKDSPNDTININPIINFISDLSPIDLNSPKSKNHANIYYSPNKFKNVAENSIINQAYFDINKLTINHNTNLTNLNLYFVYNSENMNQNEDIINNQYLQPTAKKEPKDSVRKNILDNGVHPKDKSVARENNFKKRYHSIKYSIKRIDSKSPLNNLESIFRKNNNNKINNNNNKHISNKNINTKNFNNKSNKNLNTIRNKNKKNLSKIKENYNTVEEKKKTIKEENKIEPTGSLNLSELTEINQIGKGTFGKIYSVKWIVNDKVYALKKETFYELEFVEKRNKIMKILNHFIEKTKNKGIVQIYSNLCQKNKEEYNYYELMELGEKDWEKEINSRRDNDLYYTERQLFSIASQLIKTLALLQKNHITHRDIKPQNILIVKGNYKLCDFGEIRIMEREGIVVQRIRGSELYMSPILFFGLRANMIQVKHNTYKSDIFSLGMCLLYAATLYFNCTDEIREMTDMNEIKIILNKYLSERYSNNFIYLISLMLNVEEQLRPDFIQLEEKLNNILKVKV